MNAFIDTSSLKWRYVSGPNTARLDSLLSNPGEPVAVCELTLLEWSSALGDVLRGQHMDDSWFRKNELALMTDIAEGRLLIRSDPPRLIERARNLIDLVGVGMKLSLRSGDAIQLTCAMDYADEIKSRVLFVTCDRKLANVVANAPSVIRRLDLEHL